MRIITFSGMSRSGKDYCAQRVYDILTSIGLKVAKAGFSDAIKEYTAIILGTSLENVNKFKNDESKYTVEGQNMREIVQRAGTDIFRDLVAKDYWAQTLKKKIVSLKDKDEIDVFICTDVRYQNEMHAIMSIGCGADTIYVKGNVEDADFRSHESEHGLDDFDFDYILDNTDHSKTEGNIYSILGIIFEDYLGVKGKSLSKSLSKSLRPFKDYN